VQIEFDARVTVKKTASQIPVENIEADDTSLRTPTPITGGALEWHAVGEKKNRLRMNPTGVRNN
jgi:hypothetical protein